MTARCLLSLAAATAMLAGPALAQSAAPQDEGNPLINIFKYGGTTKPPEALPNLDDVYCPIIDVAEGGASLQTMAGDTVRTQIRLGQLSRSCRPVQGGGTVVTVGVQGMVLLGPGGAPGRFNAPVTVTLKAGNQVIGRRSHQGVATIPAGQASGSFTVVEEGFVVPVAQANDFEIVVGLGSPSKPARAPRRSKPAAAAPADG